MNRKGIAELSLAAFLAVVFTAIAATPKLTLFAASNDPARSPFILAVTALTAYSQMPHVKHGFRVRKAVEKCKEISSQPDCAEMVASWTDGYVLDFIRDDEPAQVRTNGGNFVNGRMNPPVDTTVDVDNL